MPRIRLVLFVFEAVSSMPWLQMEVLKGALGGPPSWLDFYYVGSLRAAVAFNDVELNPLTFG